MKFHENRCRQCKKLFCCSNCRLAHEQKNHSAREIKCPICCSKKFQIKGDESHEFICHLVFHHLPLLCRLCGQSFRTCEDLTLLQKCGWWKLENSRRVLKILENTLSPKTPKLDVNNYIDSCNNYNSNNNNNNNNNNKNNNNNRKINSHCNKESSYFVTLNSPPVLIRNTSTPMISSGPKISFELRKSNSINLHLKTPGNFSSSLENTESPPFLDNNEFRNKCSSDSVFNSGRYSSQSKSFIQSGSSEYYTCEQQDLNSGKKLTKVEEFSKYHRSETYKKDIKQLKKTVRFSDQFSQTIEMAEYEEFFEAHENLSEISQQFLNNEEEINENEISLNQIESTFDNTDNHDNKINYEKENKFLLEENKISLENENNISLMISNVYLNDNKSKEIAINENYLHKKNISSMKNIYLKENVCFKNNIVSVSENKIYTKKNGDEEKNSFDESNIYYQQNEISEDENKENEFENIRPSSSNSNSSETNSRKNQQAAESSRIVMMLLIDNASQFSRSDLVPLIDSELKKLEETTTTTSSSSSSTSSLSSINTVYNSISNRSIGSQEEKYSMKNSQFRRKSTTSSVNSYFSIASSSSECYTAENESSFTSISNKENASYENEDSSKSDGILSAMARVVRNALKKFPGASILQESSESSNEESSSSLTKLPSPIELSSSSSLSLVSSPLSSSSSSSQPRLEQSINHLASKRPRDAISQSAIIHSPILPNEDRSPIAKRQRGWYKYKVRARPPIARMRKIQVTSPKGISSETQRFQQGSLSVGKLNTIIPLPSRAHQCTQTEK
ncbi:putative uncharacterized protein DDB_G0289263 [Leptopilina boulardi]|uniref:putative uncharacterized protein DDB_G0289263 n=1 Tax=Leptopilina boulardi TaxID=63433 RepID=UPI0021F552E4|nr:putative uncharacterized protein DDB_G0289263 [Leptopilina boulardi]